MLGGYSRRLVQRIARRAFSNTTGSSCNQALVYSQYGEPKDVLKMTPLNFPTNLASNDVLIRMIAAPINPADINTIQGVYPIRPTLPAVPGIEGCGEVVSIGPDVADLRPGDKVILQGMGFGTWKTGGVVSEEDLFKVPEQLDPLVATLLAVNPCTAYRLMKDFIQLKEGDTIIQNGANGSVGQAVIQLAKHLGVKTVNILRNRPNFGETEKYLKDIGADHVINADNIDKELRPLWDDVSPPKLGFDCVGGTSALNLARQLDKGGIMVTYGGMSKKPITLPVSLLIFKDISIRGFWMSAWKQRATKEMTAQMFQEMMVLYASEVLQPPRCRLVPFADWSIALDAAMTGGHTATEKQVLSFVDTIIGSTGSYSS